MVLTTVSVAFLAFDVISLHLPISVNIVYMPLGFHLNYCLKNKNKKPMDQLSLGSRTELGSLPLKGSFCAGLTLFVSNLRW